jgi:hypothetical protein
MSTKQQGAEKLILALKAKMTPQQIQEAARISTSTDPLVLKLAVRIMPRCLNCKKPLNHRIKQESKESQLCQNCVYLHRTTGLRKYHPELQEENAEE